MAKDQEQRPNSAEPGKKPGPVSPVPRNVPMESHGKGLWRVLVEGVIAGIAGIVVLVWLAGGFHGKVPPGTVGISERGVPRTGTVVEARLITMPKYEWAMGSIQAVHETALGSKILAKVIETKVKAGQKVNEGEVLMRLDAGDLRARVDQAKSGVDSAKARLAQAQDDYDRVMKLAKEKAAAEQEINTVANNLKSAKANLTQLEYGLAEAQTILTYSVIKAPFDGLVIDKKVEAGDTVVPGQTLVRLYDPKRMQLVATVREGLTADLRVGQSIQAIIPALNKLCCGTVAEIVPQAQSASRSFDVKVIGPCAPGIYTGMFGKLLIPVGTEKVLLIPQTAVEAVGQLNLVKVVENKALQKRSIQIGRPFEDLVEVLSGLSAGEKVWTAQKISRPTTAGFEPTYLWQGLPLKQFCPASQPQ